MPTQIFVNLPVKNVAKSKAFFAHLGFGFDSKYTNDSAACLVIDENIYAMLLTEEFFSNFTTKPICDAKKSTEVLLCLSRSSREAVDELVAKAVAAGGATPNPVQDHGFMYSHGFEDLDGHQWELMYIDPDAPQV